MVNYDVISMPDKWEYPWYAAWDLAFHCIPLAMVDPDFAKQQLDLMLSQDYLHPTGQIPAYEWNFGDVNPPVHAWATLLVYSIELQIRRWAAMTTTAFLERVLRAAAAQLHLVGQPQGPDGPQRVRGRLPRAWTTSACSTAAPSCRPAARSSRPTAPPGWRSSARTCSSWPSPARPGSRLRAVRAQVRRALLLDRDGDGPGRRAPGRDVGRGGRLLLRRAAPPRRQRPAHQGALPRRPAPALRDHRHRRRSARALPAGGGQGARRSSSATATSSANISDPLVPGVDGRRILSLVNEPKLRRILDADARRGALPRSARDPLGLTLAPRPPVRARRRRRRALASSTSRPSPTSGMFGGNSNWRGPVWFPINMLSSAPCCSTTATTATTSRSSARPARATMMTLYEVAQELSAPADRDVPARRGRPPPGLRRHRDFQDGPALARPDPLLRVLPRRQRRGLGASHQTGWTGLVARLIQRMGQFTPESVLADDHWPFARAYHRP